ncbi:MAG TPA: aminotransferase class III-fold pyridoxal phosphate-dependent enzyme [Steroidobacteraceae bacterium]|nr:aminotransferase class III-fold pyridoxal phosphate-dependent enzyme [Steroidobacteraceae bacterium]
MIPESSSVLHSWCVQADWNAPTIVGGEGARFWDAAGRTYLDMSSLAECMNLGHQHPRLIRAIQEQAQTLCFVNSSWGAASRAALAERLLEVSGFEGGRVFFTLGGADANEHAVKFARQASGRPQGMVVARDRSYHGASYATMAWSGDSRTRAGNEEPFGVLRVPPPYAYRCPYGSASDAECAERNLAHIGAAIGHAGVDNVAAVLMEPNAGTNGIIAPDAFWPGLSALTRERGVYLIADEVMSGFGRCGEWFAWQAHGEQGRPDLMTLAKGLTGAHIPLGAVILARHVAEKLEHSMLNTGLTYCGHPLACAAGVAAIDAYRDEQLIERSRRLGAVMVKRLRAMQERHAVIGDVRGGQGLFGIVELVRNRQSREPLAPWPQLHPSLVRFVAAARERGISFAVRGNLIILAPPLVIGENELERSLDVMNALLGELDWS